jgi:hypothetical protein
MLRNRRSTPQPAVTTSSVEPTHASTIAIPKAPAHIGINAFPWAEVRSVRDLNDGQEVDLHATLITPAQLDLTPGKYEITLSNPSFGKPIKQTIEVGAGQESRVNVQFSDAASAPLPDFGAAQ